MLHQGQNNAQKLHQGHALSLQQLQLLNLIQLNTLELEERIRDEVAENPALENDLPEATAEEADAGTLPLAEEEQERAEPMDDYEPDAGFDDFPDERNHADRPDFAYNLTEQEAFRFGLLEQLSLLSTTTQLSRIAAFLIESLEDDGYLRRPLEDLCDDLSFSEHQLFEMEHFEEALDLVQSLEPAGVGARNLKECLLLQLESQNRQTQSIQTACNIVRHHLEDLGAGRKTLICRQLRIEDADYEAAKKLIEKLRPRPVGNTAAPGDKLQQIVPEFLVEKLESGQLQATLLHSCCTHIRLNRHLAEQATTLGRKANTRKSDQYLKSRLAAAIGFIEMIRQREANMQQTLQTIVRTQETFFLSGDRRFIKPMILKDIALQTGLDISTISRVSSRKYVMTDFGLVALKSLFNQGFATESGELAGQLEIQEQIKALIAAEDKNSPHSDQVLAVALNEMGYLIARRTVAKYRDLLHIPAARRRQNTQDA